MGMKKPTNDSPICSATEEHDFDTARYNLMEKALITIESIFYYGDFKAETMNERSLEKILKTLGFWSYSEDELIRKIGSAGDTKDENS